MPPNGKKAPGKADGALRAQGRAWTGKLPNGRQRNGVLLIDPSTGDIQRQTLTFKTDSGVAGVCLLVLRSRLLRAKPLPEFLKA